MVRITQTSSDGEQFESFCWRDQFEINSRWQPVHTVGIFGEYSYVGPEQFAQDHVSWTITVELANGIIRN
jgi:hypothetical protein